MNINNQHKVLQTSSITIFKTKESTEQNELMNVPEWAWWTFGASLILVLLFLLLDWLIIRRNAFGIGSTSSSSSSSPLCLLSFKRQHKRSGGQSNYAGGANEGGAQSGNNIGYGPGGLFGHHKRSTNMVLAV